MATLHAEPTWDTDATATAAERRGVFRAVPRQPNGGGGGAAPRPAHQCTRTEQRETDRKGCAHERMRVDKNANAQRIEQ